MPFCLGCLADRDYLIVHATDERGRDHTYTGAYPIAPDALAALVEATRALYAIRRRIPLDVENEDANGWGRVDAALAAFDEDCCP